MHFNVSIMFDADTDDEARAVIDSWQLTPGLTISVSSFGDSVMSTTDDGGNVVKAETKPAP